MKKLVNGALVELSAAEEEARVKDCEKGSADALAHVKKAIMERIDAKLSELQRRAWMADTKSNIMAAQSVLDVRAIFDAIQWQAPSEPIGLAARPREPMIVHRPYDDKWVREQLAALAEAMRHLDRHGAQFVHDVVARIGDLERRIEEVERRPNAVAFLPQELQHKNGKAIEQPSFAPGDWKLARERVAAAEAEEAGLDHAELPPIHLNEGADIYEPEMYQPPEVEEAHTPRTVVMAESKTITDASWGKAEIAYQVAIQAKNNSNFYKGLLIGPAERRGVTVDALADHIIRERHDTVQRVMSEY